jgi:hypothetical protein
VKSHKFLRGHARERFSAHKMKAHSLDTDDKALCRLMMKSTTANLMHWKRKRGLSGPHRDPGSNCSGTS